MNSDTIKNTLLSDKYIKDIFGGIFSENQVPRLDYGQVYVVNTAPSNEGKIL